MPPRAAASAPSGASSAVYGLSLLSEYTHTLDSLPLDLSRNFADLRELDAVLSASMASITTKISALTEMVEQGAGKHEERLWLLMEIADEATRLRLGGEDKIRVACQAADNLRSHSTHLRALTEHLPAFDPATLNRRTTYPHVATKSFMPTSSLEPGRRRRTGFQASLLVSAPEPSPMKRKRAVRDDDLDHARSPRKDRLVEVVPRGRMGGRKKVVERAPSPTESLLSVTSHIPPQSNARASGSTNARAANGTAAKRSRAAAGANTRSASAQPNEYYGSHPNGRDAPGPASSSSAAAANARREAFNVPPSASHPSLVPYQNGHGGTGTGGGPHATPFELHARGHGHGHGHGGHHSMSSTPVPGAGGDWNPPHPQTLEGPGMPVARTSHGSSSGGGGAHGGGGGGPGSANGMDNSAPPEGADGEADGDDKPYCFCQRVSFGQMIACDDSTCQWEWFHISCLGLTTPPDGRWFCDACRTKRNAKRAGRGGRRKASGRARA
ncbi:hypothetical protein C8F04DRAFT_1223465 [Mycena alexandri]|uniref:Chromatin modification-related protein n=1 Tax=Mycena alexandri TaxID=1745969 RepID=A0AAD6WR80_9AGAR|nr:hypothetical protein C8F04DRAFT_1053404 [Mycena alexandri]KAJ7024376.1 hypothetical protein C8F04DRAFT_1223465 [Mycena alexandri]